VDDQLMCIQLPQV